RLNGYLDEALKGKSTRRTAYLNRALMGFKCNQSSVLPQVVANLQQALDLQRQSGRPEYSEVYSLATSILRLTEGDPRFHADYSQGTSPIRLPARPPDGPKSIPGLAYLVDPL